MRKILTSALLAIAITLSMLNFSVVKTKAEVNDVSIISDSPVSMEVAKMWAMQKGATGTFIALADLYWAYAPSHGGVNPLVAYIQAALETGYGKFGGVIDESFCNPCGLKVSSGGGNYDANAHKRFGSWDEGVQAHLDHLALYAGASGYPRSNTYDPRHFKSIFGKARTIRGLAGAWASDSAYGNKLVNAYNSVLNLAGVEITDTSQYNSSTLTNKKTNSNSSKVSSNSTNAVEEVKVVEKDPLIEIEQVKCDMVKIDQINVVGWVIADKDINNVEIFVDNQSRGNLSLDQEREDVKSSHLDYSKTDKCGFNQIINIKGISDGEKEIKIVVTTSDGNTKEATKNINISRNIPDGDSKLIVLDPGVSQDNTQIEVKGKSYDEKDINMNIALETKKQLEDEGYRVVLTKEPNQEKLEDNNEDLKNRVETANYLDADLFISIQQNASYCNKADGTEVYYSKTTEGNIDNKTQRENKVKSMILADNVSKNVSKALDSNNRGTKNGDQYVLKNTKMPSVIVACSFITNKKDSKKIVNEDVQKKLGSKIAKGAIKTLNTNADKLKSDPVINTSDPSTVLNILGMVIGMVGIYLSIFVYKKVFLTIKE